MTNQSQSAIFQNKKHIWPIAFFGSLFFLCCADLVFASRIHGFNFRWGQILLLVIALPALYRFKTGLQNHKTESILTLKFLLQWLPFFIIYGIAAVFSASPLTTEIKWIWGIFNIGLAALICLDKRENDALERGFEWGLCLIAAFIWLESLAIYVFTPFTNIKDLGRGSPSIVSFFSIPIGYAQQPTEYLSANYRPNAFYYEPSYAGCTLTFAFFLLFFLDSHRSKTKSGWIPAIVLSSVILCSSRSGILSAIIFLTGISIILAWRQNALPLLRSIIKSFVLSVLLICLFCASPNSRTYMKFLAGPMGANTLTRIHKYFNPTIVPQNIESTVQVHDDSKPNSTFSNTIVPAVVPKVVPTPAFEPISSEKTRLDNLHDSFELWMQHPFLGDGIMPQVGNNHSKGLSQFSSETWTEVGIESGTFGVLTFLFAILSNMALAWKNSSDSNLKILILFAWLIHFGIQLMLSQTFPRLDYWLIFFLSIRLLIKSGEAKPVSTLAADSSTR